MPFSARTEAAKGISEYGVMFVPVLNLESVILFAPRPVVFRPERNVARGTNRHGGSPVLLTEGFLVRSETFKSPTLESTTISLVNIATT